jgi:5'-phosphate synthase pdxT subunit
MILLASHLTNDEQINPLGLLDITVKRNGYGRQFDSFVDTGELNFNGKSEPLEMVFIRAPKITQTGTGVDTIGTCRGEVVVVRQQHILASSFHPELTKSTRFQELFLSLS